MGKDVNVAPPIVAVASQASRHNTSLPYHLTAQGVVFSGLGKGTVVEIFDSRGKLLYRLPEHSGQAIWNRSQPSALQSAGGLYWARTKSSDGAQLLGTKLLLP
jgi:hypothetical protein